MAADIDYPNVTVLDNRTVVLGRAGCEVRFIGSTLWTDFRINEGRTGQSLREAMLVASSELNDFRLIGLNGRRFTPAASLNLHEIATRFIAEELDKPFEGPTVVVTLHSPSPLTEDQYQATSLAGCFGSNLHRLMEGAGAPVAWIHGHSHEDSDVVVGQTRVVSRQRGYPGEKEFEFGWSTL
jgi:Icc-related predicted phosphoesterase